MSMEAKQPFPPGLAESVLRSSPDVIVVIDAKGKIVFVSGRCLQMLGFEPQELIGKSVEFLVPERSSQHAQAREQYQQAPEPRPMGQRPVLSALHKSGAKIPVDISLSPLPAVPGAGRLVQAVIRDALPRWSNQRLMMAQNVAISAAANGIVITDPQGVIEWVNPAVTRMTGYTAAELVGSHTRIFKSGRHPKDFYQNIWETIMTGKVWSGEIINRRKDGGLYYEDQYITPVCNDEGQIVRLIAIKQDVTARKQAEQKLQQANQKLQKQLAEIERLAALLGASNKTLVDKVQARTAELASTNLALEQVNQQLQELDNLKSAFLGVISHELRTPFVNIVMSLNLIETRGLNDLKPEQRMLFKQLNENIQSARGMIENLINYAAFVRKQGEMHMGRVRVAELVENALLPWRLKAERKTVILGAQVAAGLPDVPGDAERLMDAIGQLLDNAIKFTDAGGRVTLRVWLAQNKLHVMVEDSGVGIPAEKLATLWQSFAQMADPLQRGTEGLGLGLALVEYIARAHNGQVWAESQVGRGSKFGFRLPVGPG